MTDDDRTVDADDATMQSLRRLAADAKAASGKPEPADRTVRADDTTMDELRRFAEEARRQVTPASVGSLPPPVVPDDRTVDADDAAIEALRQDAGAAPETEGLAEPTIDLPPIAPVPENQTLPSPAVEVLADPPPPIPDVPAAGQPTADRTAARDRAIDVAAPQPASQLDTPTGSGWQPPPRMVMPTEPEKRAEVHHGPWKNIAIGLAAVVAVLAALVVFGQVRGGGDDDTPDDGSVPTEREGGSNDTEGDLDG